MLTKPSPKLAREYFNMGEKLFINGKYLDALSAFDLAKVYRDHDDENFCQELTRAYQRIRAKLEESV